MTINEVVRTTRKRLNLSEAEVAARTGLSTNEYFDLESYADEALDVVSLRKMKKLAAVLHLDLLDLFGIQCAFCKSQESPIPGPHVGRDELVRRAREAKSLSQDDLADRVGFDTVAIVQMESDPEFLETWSVGLVQELAAVLGCLRRSYSASGAPCATDDAVGPDARPLGNRPRLAMPHVPNHRA